METEIIQEVIGELLAKGHTDKDIIDTLKEEKELGHEEACAALRDVYNDWQHTREALDLNANNLIDWHVFLRKHILEVALGERTTPSLRLALSVLDSLATIQGISTVEGQTVPLTIQLMEKKEDGVNTKSDNVTDHAQGESDGSEH